MNDPTIRKTFPIGAATTSSGAVNRISLALALSSSNLQLAVRSAGIFYTFGKGTNAAGFTTLSGSQVQVVSGVEYLLPMTDASTIEEGMTLLIQATGGGTVRGRCVAQARSRKLKSGSGDNTVDVLGALSGGVSTDDVLFMDPVAGSVGAYLAAGQTEIIRRPPWANYLYFVRESSTDANVVITEVD